MPRTFLIHLNVIAPDSHGRTADQIANAILAAIEVGGDDDVVCELTVDCPLAEEVDPDE